LSILKKSIICFTLILSLTNVWSQNKLYVYQDTIKKPLISTIEVLGLNVGVNRFNLLTKTDKELSEVTLASWKSNLTYGLEWDWDNFGVNFIGHPYQGAHYYNSARTNGFGFFESAPFTFMGSLTWEMFGETHPPSGNDLINTTMGGMFLGEIMYRVSHLVIDENSFGFERGLREFIGFVINPMNGFNRLVSGKMKYQGNHFEYVRPKYDGDFSIATVYLTRGVNIPHVKTSYIIDGALNYGEPFDERISNKKPYDLFSVEGWLRLSKDTLSNRHFSIYGHGNLFFKDISKQESFNKHGIGLFQTYDFFNGGLIEIGDMGVSAGLISHFKIGKEFKLKSIILAGPIILGGSNSEVVDPRKYSDDLSNNRDYIMGPGLQSKIEIELASNKFGDIKFKHHFWNIFIASGPAGVEHLQGYSFDYELPVFKPFYLGSRYLIYNRNANYNDYDDINKRIDELRIYANYRF